MKKLKNFYVGAHCCFLLQYHLVIVSKYRRKIFTNGICEKLAELIQIFFERHELVILEYEICPDHIHILFEAYPDMNIAHFVGSFKAWSAKILRREYLKFLRRFYWKPYFWNKSYFIATVSERTTEAVKDYIRNQNS